MKALVRWVALAAVIAVAYSTGLLAAGTDATARVVRDVSGAFSSGSSVLAAAPAGAEATSRGTYTFLSTGSDGEPVTWATCDPIRVLINPAGAPDGAVDDMITAIGRVAEFSGLAFVYAGTTDAALTTAWGRTPTDGVYPPVLVGWDVPSNGLVGEVSGGRAHMVHLPGGPQPRYVSGMVVINAELDSGRPGGFDVRGSRGALYLHELAHVAGLGHVQHSGELMYPHSGFTATYGDGDLAGFEAVRQATCPTNP